MITYSLGLLVLIYSLVRRVRKVNLRAQLRDDVMAASKKNIINITPNSKRA